MRRNYMKKIAEMLGVEFMCDFNIKNHNNNPYQIKECGLADCNGNYNEDLLASLLIGCAEIDKNILTDKEKEYLSSVIAPRQIYKEIVWVSKVFFDNHYCIVFCGNKTGRFSLPFFSDSNMYKGMKVGEEYTLEELGLDRDE